MLTIAIGRVMARQLMDYINTHSINLRAIFREFKSDQELKLVQKRKKLAEEISAADFLTLLHAEARLVRRRIRMLSS